MVRWDESCSRLLFHAFHTWLSFHINTREVSFITITIDIWMIRAVLQSLYPSWSPSPSSWPSSCSAPRPRKSGRQSYLFSNKKPINATDTTPNNRHRWPASIATGREWSPSPTLSGSTSTAWNMSLTRFQILSGKWLNMLDHHQPEVLVSCLLFPPKRIHTLPHLLWLVGINDFIIRFLLSKTLALIIHPTGLTDKWNCVMQLNLNIS